MKKYTTSQRLKEIMNSKGIKQIDILNRIQPICKKWGIKMGSNDLSQYVTGKVEPSQKKLSLLAEALDTNEVWLMGYDVPMNKELSVDDFSYSSEDLSPYMISDGLEQKYNNINQLSLKTEIPVIELKRILKGENKIPKPKHLKRIADTLQTNVTDYFNGYGYIQSSEFDCNLFESGIRFLLSEEDRYDLCHILYEIWHKEDKNITVDSIYNNLFNIEKEGFSSNDIKYILNSNNKSQFHNEYDEKIKQLETNTGVKVSYSAKRKLTQEDFLAINQLVLDEMRAQEKDKK